jgi:hypothetical protein
MPVKTPLILLLFAILSPVVSASEYEHLLSPDRRFEAYTTPHNPDGTGARLFLRTPQTNIPGALLRENDRWIRTNWSPDSHFLAVIDGSDGHVTDVFIYRVLRYSRTTVTKAHYLNFPGMGEIADSASAPGILAELWYHTPAPWTYDVQWDLAGWDISRNIVLLTKRSRAFKDTKIRVVLDSTQTHK